MLDWFKITPTFFHLRKTRFGCDSSRAPQSSWKPLNVERQQRLRQQSNEPVTIFFQVFFTVKHKHSHTSAQPCRCHFAGIYGNSVETDVKHRDLRLFKHPWHRWERRRQWCDLVFSLESNLTPYALLARTLHPEMSPTQQNNDITRDTESLQIQPHIRDYWYLNWFTVKFKDRKTLFVKYC